MVGCLGGPDPLTEDSSDEEDVHEKVPLVRKRQKRKKPEAIARLPKGIARPPPPPLTWVPGHYELPEQAGPSADE